MYNLQPRSLLLNDIINIFLIPVPSRLLRCLDERSQRSMWSQTDPCVSTVPIDYVCFLYLKNVGACYRKRRNVFHVIAFRTIDFLTSKFIK